MLQVAFQRVSQPGVTCRLGLSAVRVSAAAAPAKLRLMSTVRTEILLERLADDDTGIAVMTLNRPAAKNALGRQMMSEFTSALEEVNRDTAIRTLIVRSSVPGVFCAGADLKERATMSPAEAEAFVDLLRNSFQALSELPPPTIACIEGAALGGGLEMALACDFRVAGGDAILGLPETSLAIIPGAGGTQRLPRLIGAEKAKQLVFSAARLKAAEAQAFGLVTALAAPGKAYEQSLALARSFSSNGPIALRQAKKAIQTGLDAGAVRAGLAAEKAAYMGVLGTKDRLEGLAAFREKRKPVYKGE